MIVEVSVKVAELLEVFEEEDDAEKFEIEKLL